MPKYKNVYRSSFLIIGKTSTAPATIPIVKVNKKFIFSPLFYKFYDTTYKLYLIHNRSLFYLKSLSKAHCLWTTHPIF